jgi:histidinol-phosphate/aromatic aminotransferase/cobyric acid decarboxylase-like protein
VLEALGHHLARQGGPGGEIVYSNPGYTALVEAAQAYGGVGAPVPLDAQLGNDLPALRARIGPRTRAVFLVNPHNPSGTLNEAAALHEFVAQAARHVAVVVDEAYLELAPDFAERSLARQVAPGGRVIVFRTFTKFFGLAALPLGYAILPIELAGTLRQQGLGAARAQNRLAVVVAARASLSDTTYQERVRRAVGSERERWFEVLDSLGLRRTRAAGNFVSFAAAARMQRSRRHLPNAASISAERSRRWTIGRASRSACPKKTHERSRPCARSSLDEAGAHASPAVSPSCALHDGERETVVTFAAHRLQRGSAHLSQTCELLVETTHATHVRV